MGITQEFKDFLAEYKVVGIAVAFIIGLAASTLIQSFVNNIVMPIVFYPLPASSWNSIAIQLSPTSSIAIGSFISALLYFIVVIIVIFVMLKILYRGKRKK